MSNMRRKSMRRFIRFMSENELEKYLKGETLVNEKVHAKDGSFGFCFFDAMKIDPITAHHMLTGIATMQYMVEFMVDAEVVDKVLTKSKARYHLPNTPSAEWHILEEYCTKSYSRKDFIPYQVWQLMINYPSFTCGK